MTKELLQQCLKALLPHGSCYGNGKRPVEDAAIEGLEQALAQQEQPAQEAVAWEGAEDWEPLAWHLCAEENGEEACSELIWEGGAIPEPWGDRWLKYEHEAKRMIATVKKYTAPTQPALSESQITSIAYNCNALPEVITDKTLVDFVRAIEAHCRGGQA